MPGRRAAAAASSLKFILIMTTQLTYEPYNGCMQLVHFLHQNDAAAFGTHTSLCVARQVHTCTHVWPSAHTHLLVATAFCTLCM